MEMKRISKHSNIGIKTTRMELNFNPDIKIIQIIVEEPFIIFEYIPKENIEKYMEENTGRTELTQTEEETPFDAQPKKTKEQMDLETALDTILNKDPMGKYDGCNLRIPFDRGDIEWVDWVLKNMHNKFIRDKVELIKVSGYGNFNN